MDRGKRGIERPMAVDANGASLWAPSGAGRPPRLPALGRDAGDPAGARGFARADHGASRPRPRFGGHARTPEGSWPGSRDLREGQTRSATGQETPGGGAHELPEQRPQGAFVVHGKAGAGRRLLIRLLRGGHRRAQAHWRSLDSLPLGGPTLATTVTCCRKL